MSSRPILWSIVLISALLLGAVSTVLVLRTGVAEDVIDAVRDTDAPDGGAERSPSPDSAPAPTDDTDDTDHADDPDDHPVAEVDVRRGPQMTPSELRPPTARAPIPRLLTSSPSLELTPVVADPGVQINPEGLGAVVVTGSGWGHSVGMSQYGARALAAEGRDHTEILERYYPGTEVGVHPSGQRTLRMHLTWGRQRDHSLLALGARDGAVDIGVPVADDLQIADGETWELRAAGSRVVVLDADGEEVARTASRLRLSWTNDGTSRLVVPSLARRNNAAAGQIAWGTLEVSAEAGRLHPVLVLDLESYLRGVAEMPPSWESAALRAQAVAARTFAARHIAEGLDPDCRCHLGATPLFQAWNALGMEAQTGGQRWVQAVTDTAGEVVTFDGAPAWTYYSSSHGGRSEAAEDSWAFGTPLPYLVSLDDPWSVAEAAQNSRAEWSVELDNAEVAALFGLVAVDGIVVVDRTAGGSPKTLRATGTAPDGSTVTADASGVAASSAAGDLRLLMGAALPSQQITSFEVLPPEPDPDSDDADDEGDDDTVAGGS